jgi:radical SAM protein with 4Fe4S-binding SPASM domain
MDTITTRIDHVTLVPEDWKKTVLPAPPSIKWELYSGCQYACSYCSIQAENKNNRMDLELFKRASKQALDFGVREAGLFFIGESTLAPDLLLDALRWVKQIGYPYVFLTTNGANLSPDLAEELMNCGIDSLKFSINAADALQFREVMRVKPALFDRALQNLQEAWRIRNGGGYQTRIYASSIELDGEQGKRLEALLERQVRPFVDEHYMLPNFGQMSSKNAEKNRAMGFRPSAGNQGRLQNLREVLPCWSAFREGHVRWNGMLSACCFGATPDWDCGDLNEQSFAEAWNSQAYQDLRAAHLRGDVHGTPCESCVYG